MVQFGPLWAVIGPVRCGLGLCGGAGAAAIDVLTCDDDDDDDDDDDVGAGGERPQPERASIKVAAPSATATPKRQRLVPALAGSADVPTCSEISRIRFIRLPVPWPEQHGLKKVGVEKFDC
jgi:hypothetical protein